MSLCTHGVPNERDCPYCTPGRYLPAIKTRNRGQVQSDRKELDPHDEKNDLPTKTAKGTKPTKKVIGTKGIEGLSGKDAELGKKLMELRLQLAGTNPAYTVFDDRTLRGLVETKPQSIAALLDVWGIGEIRAERYGPQILAVIAKYR